MKFLNKSLILLFILLIFSIGAVSANDSGNLLAQDSNSDYVDNLNGDYDSVYDDSISEELNSEISVNPYSSDSSLSNKIESRETYDSGSNVNTLSEAGSLSSGSESNIIKINESNYNEYFDDKGNVYTYKVSNFDIIDLSGNFTGKVFNFTIPVNVTSLNSDAYLYNSSIIFDHVVNDKWSEVSNLYINNSCDKVGVNCVLIAFSKNILVTNNILYSESSSGNPVRLGFSNYVNVTNNILETWYGTIISEDGSLQFNNSWTHSGIMLAESHNNYIASNYVTVKESNPIYLAAYGVGPSNYNVIFNNTVRSSSVHNVTGLPNPSSWTYGIQLMGSNNKVLNNTIYNVYRGVSSEGKYNEVVGNILFNITGGYGEGNNGTDGGEAAIYGTIGTLIANNTILSSNFSVSGGAIYVGKNNTVYGNYININSGYSINLGEGSDNSIIYNNTMISKDSKEGIIHSIGSNSNVTICDNYLYSENGDGILFKKVSIQKIPKSIYIFDNEINVSGNLFNLNDVQSDLICENNTCKKRNVVVDSSNFFSFFDEEGFLKDKYDIFNYKYNNDYSIVNLIFKGDFVDLAINSTLVDSITIDKPISITGENCVIKNIPLVISSNDINISNIKFVLEDVIKDTSAISVTNAKNVNLTNNQIFTDGLDGIVVSGSIVNIYDNEIRTAGSGLGVLAISGSQVFIIHNFINSSSNYAINLTDTGDSSSENLKNNISDNYLVSKSSNTIYYSPGCENNNIIGYNEGIHSYLVFYNNSVFINSNPLFVVGLYDIDNNPISNAELVLTIISSNGTPTKLSVFTNDQGLALVNANLTQDNYKVSINFNGHSFYCPSNLDNQDLSVKLRDVELSVESIESYYGIPIIINVTFTSIDSSNLDGKKIYLNISGTISDAVTSNGTAQFRLGFLNVGDYDLKFYFEEDENCSSASTNSTLKIVPMATNLDVNNLVMFYNDGTKLIVYLKDNENNPIYNQNLAITLNGKTYNLVTDSAGKVSLAINLVPKTYTATIKFIGDGNYLSSNKSISVQVKTRTTKIVASNLVKYYGDSKTLVAYLKDTNNKAIASKTVSITINGKTYKKTTDKNGKVSLSISLSPKTYYATFKFSGNYHTSATKKVSVKIVKPSIKATSTKVKKGKKLTIVFKDVNKKVIKSQKVYFKFLGKKYTAITSSKGTITLTCNIKKGSYNVVAGFSSTKTYGKTTATIKFKVV
ncbi:MAG: hypothetical protein MJ232_02565 [archaeon]|nr:hypothetical protein [archaeon]